MNKTSSKIGHAKYFNDGNENMSFKARDCKAYCRKENRSLMKKKIDSEPVNTDAYGNEYIKTKIKLCGDIINANFQGKT